MRQRVKPWVGTDFKLSFNKTARFEISWMKVVKNTKKMCAPNSAEFKFCWKGDGWRFRARKQVKDIHENTVLLLEVTSAWLICVLRYSCGSNNYGAKTKCHSKQITDGQIWCKTDRKTREITVKRKRKEWYEMF